MTQALSALVPVDVIDDTDRLRPVDPAWVEALAATMAERGLDQPIVIRPTPAGDAEYALVAGAHRLAAAKALGWGEIRAEVRDLDELQARLAEIDENLVRHELNALDRGLFLLERKCVYERLYPETAHGGDGKFKEKLANSKSPTWRLGKRFSVEAAEKVGFSERTVQRAIETVAGLDPRTIRLLRGTDLVDNAVALKSLGELGREDQVHLVTMIAHGDARDLKQARILAEIDSPTDRDPQERLFTQLVDLYGRANQKTKRRFEEHAGLVIRAGRSA